MEEPHGSLERAKHSGRELGWGGRGVRLFQGSGGPWRRGACLQVLERLRCAADTWAITGVPRDLRAAPSHPQGWVGVCVARSAPPQPLTQGAGYHGSRRSQRWPLGGQRGAHKSVAEGRWTVRPSPAHRRVRAGRETRLSLGFR